MRNYGKEWSSGLSAEDKRSVYEYTGMAYGNINRVLRGLEDSFDPGNLENARNIHRVLSQAEIPEDCVVYRGASESALGIARVLPDRLLVGRTITDDGFMSTSLDRGSAFSGKVLFEIDVPKGAAGAYVGDISAAGQYEREVLFDKDQILIITNVTRDEDGRRIIKAKMRGRR